MEGIRNSICTVHLYIDLKHISSTEKSHKDNKYFMCLFFFFPKDKLRNRSSGAWERKLWPDGKVWKIPRVGHGLAGFLENTGAVLGQCWDSGLAGHPQ